MVPFLIACDSYIQSCLSKANSLLGFPTLYKLLWVASRFDGAFVFRLKLSKLSLVKGDFQTLSGDSPKETGSGGAVTVNLNMDSGLVCFVPSKLSLSGKHV